MVQEVTEFVVIAPASMGKAVEYARERILDRLARSFPQYRFQIEPYGPIIQEDGFSVIPVMGEVGGGWKTDDPRAELLAAYPPQWLFGAIKDVLREFELAPGLN